MEGPKKYPAGRILVIVILAVGIFVAWVSHHYYAARHPASLSAHVGQNNIVLAQFPPQAEKIIRPGMLATISLDGTPRKGRVAGRDLMQENTYVITLAPSQITAVPNTKATVIVDTTVPPELLKDR